MHDLLGPVALEGQRGVALGGAGICKEPGFGLVGVQGEVGLATAAFLGMIVDALATEQASEGGEDEGAEFAFLLIGLLEEIDIADGGEEALHGVLGIGALEAAMPCEGVEGEPVSLTDFAHGLGLEDGPDVFLEVKNGGPVGGGKFRGGGGGALGHGEGCK